MKKKSAFTLVELLVVITLFSLLLVTAFYSFRFVSLNIRNINNTNPQEAMNYSLLRDAFSSVYYYIDNDKTKTSGREHYFYYFEGAKKSCRFISNSSVFYNELVMVEIAFLDNKLIYKEGKIFSTKSNYELLSSINLDKKITLLKGLSVGDISYKTKKSMNGISKEIPKMVQINFIKNKKEYSYIFTIKSTSSSDLERLIRDYDLSKNIQSEFQ